MHEKPKSKNKNEENREAVDKSLWSNDQQKKSYYYDDSHGYKVYNPDEDDDEEDVNETEKK